MMNHSSSDTEKIQTDIALYRKRISFLKRKRKFITNQSNYDTSDKQCSLFVDIIDSYIHDYDIDVNGSKYIYGSAHIENVLSVSCSINILDSELRLKKKALNDVKLINQLREWCRRMIPRKKSTTVQSVRSLLKSYNKFVTAQYHKYKVMVRIVHGACCNFTMTDKFPITCTCTSYTVSYPAWDTEESMIEDIRKFVSKKELMTDMPLSQYSIITDTHFIGELQCSKINTDNVRT